MGIHDILAIGLYRDTTTIGSLAFVRHVSAGDIRERELEVTGLLVPHLQRAITISRLLGLECILTAAFEQTIEALSCAVMLTDEHGVILLANNSAENMLKKGYPIRNSGGKVAAVTTRASHELRKAIRSTASNGTEFGKLDYAIHLSEADELPLFAYVLPMKGSDMREQLQPRATAAIFIQPVLDAQYVADKVATTFNLTPAETRVFAMLLSGKTLAESAAILNIARTTAKTHLESIFRKTGVNRQTELIRLATRNYPITKNSA
jgi:DNA-binding CsgD family transcriptional regulator